MKRVRPSKRQISRLVSCKLNMTSNMLFKMVISLLDSDLTAKRMLEVFYCSCCVYYLLSSLLNVSWCSVSNFKIQKFSLSISRCVEVSLDLEVFVNWAIMVNLACLSKLWLSCWNCLQAIIVSPFFTSFFIQSYPVY